MTIKSHCQQDFSRKSKSQELPHPRCSFWGSLRTCLWGDFMIPQLFLLSYCSVKLNDGTRRAFLCSGFIFLLKGFAEAVKFLCSAVRRFVIIHLCLRRKEVLWLWCFVAFFWDVWFGDAAVANSSEKYSVVNLYHYIGIQGKYKVIKLVELLINGGLEQMWMLNRD